MKAFDEMTDQEVESVKYFAGLLYTDAELADILEVEPAEVKALMRDVGNPLRRVIITERYKVESAIRESQINMAKHGSTPAMDACNQLIRKIK